MVVNGLAVETGGGSGAVNMCVVEYDECNGGVGLGGAVFDCCCC